MLMQIGEVNLRETTRLSEFMEKQEKKDKIKKYEIICTLILPDNVSIISFSDQTLEQWGAPHFQDCKNKSISILALHSLNNVHKKTRILK